MVWFQNHSSLICQISSKDFKQVLFQHLFEFSFTLPNYLETYEATTPHFGVLFLKTSFEMKKKEPRVAPKFLRQSFLDKLFHLLSGTHLPSERWFGFFFIKMRRT